MSAHVEEDDSNSRSVQPDRKSGTKERKKKRDGLDEFENTLAVLVSLTACNPLLLPS